MWMLFATLLMLAPTTKPMNDDFLIEDADAFRQVVPEGARVRKLADGFRFVEGPVWTGGVLRFSDIPAARIYAWSPDEGMSVFRDNSGAANGNTLDNAGHMLTCEHDTRVVSITLGADRSVLVDRFKHDGRDARFNSPNDVVVRRDGTVWFTDPPYGIPPEKRDAEMQYGGRWVFRYDPKDESVTPVAKDFDFPNGLCFSPDESVLYVADSGDPKHVRRFAVNADGTLSGGEVFCKIDKGVPDGMRCDASGRLFSTAGDGIQIFAVDGHRVGKILVAESPANCTFGGEGNKTLFITAQRGLYAIDLGVAGAK